MPWVHMNLMQVMETPNKLANEGDSSAQTRFETELTPIDSPLMEGNTSWSDEGRLDTNELMDTNVQNDISSDPPL